MKTILLTLAVLLSACSPGIVDWKENPAELAKISAQLEQRLADRGSHIEYYRAGRSTYGVNDKPQIISTAGWSDAKIKNFLRARGGNYFSGRVKRYSYTGTGGKKFRVSLSENIMEGPKGDMVSGWQGTNMRSSGYWAAKDLKEEIVGTSQIRNALNQQKSGTHHYRWSDPVDPETMGNTVRH